MPIQLKKHNQEAYNKVKEIFKNSNRAAVIHPPGTGKTSIALKLLEENKGKKAIYVAPSIPILHNLKKFIFESGMKMSDFPGLKRITYAKLMRMSDEEIEKLGADIIVLDEFHHCGAPEWGEGVQCLLKRNENAKVLGLSATPIRYFDKLRNMAEELFGRNIASEMTLEEAIDRGILPEATYVSALYSYNEELEKMKQDIEKIPEQDKRKNAQELFQELKGKLDKNTTQLPELLTKYMEKKNGKYIVFCRNIEDMKQKMQAAQEMFGCVNSKITTYSVSSENNIRQTEKTLSAFEKADDDSLKLMFAVNMLNEGYHIQDLDGVIMMRPTFSPTIFIQQIGRALSIKKENGKPPVILDLVDNFDSCKIIEDFCERMSQYKGKKGNKNSNQTQSKSRLSIFDKTKEFREIANKITELSQTKGVSLEDKVDLIIKCAQTGEEVISQTVYQGQPVGSWLIQFRSQINTGKNLKLTEEQISLLRENGLLDKRIEATIDEKIDELIEWNKQYPFAKLPRLDSRYDLGRYTNSEKEYIELLKKYQKIQDYYGYVRTRKSQGKLTSEQEQKCKEGNIRGAFGYPERTENLSRKYGLKIEKIDYILSKYGNMENFIIAFRNGKLDSEDKVVLEGNLNLLIDVSQQGNIRYIKFIKQLVKNFSIKESDNDKIKFFDSRKLSEVINSYDSKKSRCIKFYYGFNGAGVEFTQKEIGEVLKISSQAVSVTIKTVIRSIIKTEKFTPTIFQGGEFDYRRNKFLTPEQEMEIESLLEPIYNSNLIFIPDEGYTQNSSNITSEQLIDIARQVREIRLQKEVETSKKEENPQFVRKRYTPIEELDLSVRSFNVLLRAGIRTVEKLRYDNLDHLSTLRNMGRKSLYEIQEKVRRMIPDGEEIFIEDTRKESEVFIDELEIYDDLFYVLKKANINTVADLRALSPQALENIEGISKRQLNELQQFVLPKLERKYGPVPEGSDKQNDETQENKREFERTEYTPITDFDFSVRAINILTRMGIKTIQQLRYKTLDEIAAYRNMGVRTLNEIQEIVRAFFSEDESIFTPDTRTETEVPVDELDISDELFYILKRAHIDTVADLMAFCKEDLENIEGIQEEDFLETLQYELDKLEKKYSPRKTMTELERLKQAKIEAADGAESERIKAQKAVSLYEEYSKLGDRIIENEDSDKDYGGGVPR